MNQSMTGYLIGGVIPAILYGVFSILQKEAAQRGAGPGTLLVFMGIGIFLIGLINCWLMPEPQLTFSKAGIASFLTGICWAMAISLIQIGFCRFNIPVSKLMPIINTNTIVAIGLGLIIFHEWSSVNVGKLSVAAFLVIMGGILAIRA
jgi:hypothetical protein